MTLKVLDVRGPATEVVQNAIERYVDRVSSAYGSELVGVYLFGSRSRGDHHDLSDVDLAVVLDRTMPRRWPEMNRLGDLAFPFELETGLLFHVWPVSAVEWRDPERGSAAHLVRSMQREARPLL
jgi:antitoxin ChpS